MNHLEEVTGVEFQASTREKFDYLEDEALSPSTFNFSKHIAPDLKLEENSDLLVVSPHVAARILKSENLHSSFNQICELMEYDPVKSTLESGEVPCRSYALFKSLIDKEIDDLFKKADEEDLRFTTSDYCDKLIIIGPGLAIKELSSFSNVNSVVVRFPSSVQSSLIISQLKEILDQAIRKKQIHFPYDVYEMAPYMFIEEKSDVFAFWFCFPKLAQQAYGILADASDKIFGNQNLVIQLSPLKAYPMCDFSPYGKPLIENEFTYSDTCAVDDKCSVCDFLIADENLFSFYRLMQCGHIVCGSCIIQLIGGGSQFPIKCKFHGCPAYLLFEDLKNVVERKLCSLEHLKVILTKSTEKSLESFIKRNNHFRHCTNCGFIFEVFFENLSEPATYICKQCRLARCSACGHSSHSSVNCQDNYNIVNLLTNSALFDYFDQTGNLSFDIRFCPNVACATVIQRDFGCNHVQCSNCDTHFCWICPDFRAPSPMEVYAHLREYHLIENYVGIGFEQNMMQNWTDEQNDPNGEEGSMPTEILSKPIEEAYIAFTDDMAMVAGFRRQPHR